MGFSIRLDTFAEDLTTSINKIRLQLLGAEPPRFLFHYTNSSVVQNIANTGVLWATPVVGLEDKMEIHHGAHVVSDEVTRARNAGLRGLPAEVLFRVPEAVIARMDHIYVACFCSMESSEYHWTNYGDHCLKFDTDFRREPILRPLLGDAYVGYHHVIYGERHQRQAIRKAIHACIHELDRKSAGANAGACADPMVKSVARGVTELFLDLIVAFKNECYEGEQEWRLAVRPRSALYSAAPADDDQRFRSIIRTGSGLKHIDLYVPRKFSSSASFLCPEVPFSAVVLSPKCPAEGAEKIRRVLSENGRVDIPVAVGV